MPNGVLVYLPTFPAHIPTHPPLSKSSRDPEVHDARNHGDTGSTEVLHRNMQRRISVKDKEGPHLLPSRKDWDV